MKQCPYCLTAGRVIKVPDDAKTCPRCCASLLKEEHPKQEKKPAAGKDKKA